MYISSHKRGIEELGKVNHNTFVPAIRNDSILAENFLYLEFWHSIYIKLVPPQTSGGIHLSYNIQ